MADNYTPPAYSDQWQLTERASARLVARDSRYPPNYYPSSFPEPQQQPPPPPPRVVQPPPKRRSPEDESPQPNPKRPKSAAVPGPRQSTATSKRGYPAKKRNDAQIAAQNAKAMTQLSYTTKQGKEKSNAVTMQIVPLGPNDRGQALHAEPQSTRCMSTKYKNDPFPRCVACTRRWAGDTCRFQGIRYFLRDSEMKIVGVTFSETQKADSPSMKFPTSWNEKLTEEHIARTKKTIAKALLPILRLELTHLRQETIIHRPREREVRATCDTCMTSLFSSSWLCRLCGREACADCYATVCDLTLERPGISQAETQALQTRREKHQYANPFFLQCTKRVEHKAVDFSPMSRFCMRELEDAIGEMEEVVRSEEQQEAQQAQIQMQMQMQMQMQTYPIPLPIPLSAPPFIPPYLSPLTQRIPSLPLPHYTSSALTPSTFPALWALGSPLVVVGLLPRFKIHWTPEYFIEKYGNQSCLVIECQTEASKRVTVGEFFRSFGRYEERAGMLGSSSSSSSTTTTITTTTAPGSGGGLGREGEVWKLKDWPPSMDFKKAFPELWEDFGGAVPVPSYVRRDGVMNIASHFPEDTVAPDIGPKMYNAMATTQEAGSKGSTRLHMDMADALNIMTYAAPAPDGSQGCAAWDLFRAEDSDKIRGFLAEHARSASSTNPSSNGNNGAGSNSNATTTTKSGGKEARVDWTSNDPIHGQQFYLDEEMREKLYLATGVRSFRFYQRPGEAVFIPAGCAHQEPPR
ncbi:hypothetical protein C0995_015574 [Termitomyces sp. Mi166|nr:hypothetical protein C0995_015574 [Termitomyces sp. Mi166\